jgi:hypothetical protein
LQKKQSQVPAYASRVSREELPNADAARASLAGLEKGPGPLREFDRASKVRDGLVVPAGEAFATSHVVEQVGVRWIARQQFARSICRLGVVARLVKGPQ